VELAWREIDGEIVAVDTRTSTYLSTNSSATALWRALSEGTTRKALVDELVSRFDVERATAETDVDAFLADLGRQGLLADDTVD
jgi:hypothetical protein